MHIAGIPDDLPNGTFLIHGRPRLTFHLGHVKMLNVVYELLSRGHNVIIQIVPYYEHESRNRTLRIRLAEESELTRGFYRNYLGFEVPRLAIVNTLEQDIPHERLLDLQRRYASLYENGNTAIKRLIDEHRRAWTSPNILFMPKCIASIESLAPDYMICGDKHGLIADAFETLLQDSGRIAPISYQFTSFKDLLLETPMDQVDSSHTYIDINDNEDFVLHKLSMLKELPDVRRMWLNHFVEHIFAPAPERIKEGLTRTLRSEAEIEIALARFLASVRQLVPYTIDETAEVNVNWNTSLLSVFSQMQRQITRVTRQVFRDTNAQTVSIHRALNAGKSGSIVLEVWEHQAGTNSITNVSILKIGSEAEMRTEKQNYDRFISPRKTGAFMAVKLGTVSVDGSAGIAYQDAQHYLGMSVKDEVGTLASLFDHPQFDLSRASVAIEQATNHLYEVLYKDGSRVEAGSVGRGVNEFLPVDLVVQVVSCVGLPGFNSSPTGSLPYSDKVFRGNVKVTEVHLRRRIARAYDEDTGKKLDLKIAESDEALLNAIRVGVKIFVEGHILSTRAEFYEKLYKQLGVVENAGFISINREVEVLNPTAHLNDILSQEHFGYIVSPVHGDLHSENVLYGKGNVGIIDYGKMREGFPSLYDLAYLLADLRVRYFTKHHSLRAAADLEMLFSQRSVRLSGARRRAILDRIRLFEYSSLPATIRSLGSEKLFYCLTTAILLGRLKFTTPDHEKRMTLLLANCAYLKARN